ncbi:GNAT family N-acetyltransferase [Desulfobotulus sp.]|uniref:GNAT family N-acetyltransferase n=1 Tax=Desulfobotulus sp. TaxID=1940337 RepID=UPI002A366F6C|nr:GNAT family N-acetyltransferase [Desulfobotulus sp.]MDY0162289.1 GNAT family N-acetyltransferase [Desulfobotulus sp.]
MQIRDMTKKDFETFWPVFQKILKDQETYALNPDMDMEEAHTLWCTLPLASYVAVEGEEILGTYYLKPNAAGPGAHICNCGYMVAPRARGKGIARALCLHSQEMARAKGFQGMQFNAVVSSNDVAVRLWRKLGYSILGTVPGGYLHPVLGYVDTYIMFQKL